MRPATVTSAGLLGLAALLAAPAAAFEELLSRNLVYRSPSSNVDISIDIDHIARRVKRSTPADELEANWNPDVGIDGQAAYKGSVSYPYGVAAGDPYPNSAILWTSPKPAENTSLPICLRYQVSSSKAFSKVTDEGYAWTTQDVDYTFKVEAQNLKPKTAYFYRFSTCANKTAYSPVGTFKTFPEADDASVDKLGIAAFSCSNYPFGFFNAYAHAAKDKDVDYALHLGDWIYEYTGDGSADSYGDGRAINRVPEPNVEISTLEQYRIRHAQYRTDNGLKALTQSKALIAVWDDHEVADNTWKGGSANSNDTAAGEINGVRFTDRKRNAVRAYHEWMPVRQVDTTDDLRLWRQFQYGKLVDLSMLDTRQYERDLTDLYYNTPEVASMFNDTARSLMGGKQEKWLYKNLVDAQKRGAIWKVVGQQIVLGHISYGAPGFNTNYDSWDGYNANRRRLFKTVQDNKIENMIYLSGDSHTTWLNEAVPQEWTNDTKRYNPATGAGALGVEFAGTAVSSPQSIKAKAPMTDNDNAKRLVSTNLQLQYSETFYRGYFSLLFSKQKVDATFWGTPNVTVESDEAIALAKFEVKKGANRLTRPLNGGKKPISGVLQPSAVDYAKQKWNGTAFV